MGRFFAVLLALLLIAAAAYSVYLFRYSSMLTQSSTTIDDVIRESRALGYDFGTPGEERGEVKSCVWTPCGGCIETVGFDNRGLPGVVYYDKHLTRFDSPENAQCNAGSLLFGSGMRCTARGYFSLCITPRLTGSVEDDPFYALFMRL